MAAPAEPTAFKRIIMWGKRSAAVLGDRPMNARAADSVSCSAKHGVPAHTTSGGA
jgi:hypothetical protein